MRSGLSLLFSAPRSDDPSHPHPGTYQRSRGRPLARISTPALTICLPGSFGRSRTQSPASWPEPWATPNWNGRAIVGAVCGGSCASWTSGRVPKAFTRWVGATINSSATESAPASAQLRKNCCAYSQPTSKRVGFDTLQSRCTSQGFDTYTLPWVTLTHSPTQWNVYAC